MWLRGVPAMESLQGLDAATASTTQQTASVGRAIDPAFNPAFNWQGLQRVRAQWPGKLLLKGVLRADDAARAVAVGCDGVIVSNHGGRQLDGGLAALDALPAVAAQVGRRAEVWMDGGVRRGSDIVKALALGARGVLVGRAVLYGVCAAGEVGASRALEVLRDELLRTLQLCGVARVDDIGAHLLAHVDCGSRVGDLAARM